MIIVGMPRNAVWQVFFLNHHVLQSWLCLVATPGLRLARNFQPCVRDADFCLTIRFRGRNLVSLG